MIYLNIRKEPGNSLTKQIYEQIRDTILKGALKAGEKLPSTREMALFLNVSRNSVVTAYEMLHSEGYIAGVPGSGMFVAQGIDPIKPPEKIKNYSATAFSTRELARDTVDFHSGTPALDLFPRAKWNRIAAKAFREAPVSALGYDVPEGRPELRNTLASYLNRTRGINCRPDQILITTGAKQGLSLVAKCLLRPGKEAWIEDPSNSNVKKIFSYHTDRIRPLRVDHEGVRPDLFPRNGSPALIFVTPSHQFPLGGILSIQRRMELVRYARKAGCYIIEDDYDSEFRYRGLPISSLLQLDSERVVYTGTFSKILFPSVRLGYIVLPGPLVEQCREWKRLGDHHTHSLDQLTLLRFIESGDMERHLSRMRKIYRKRRDHLISRLNACFPGKVRIMGEKAGIHLVAEFLGTVFTPALIKILEKVGVRITPVEEHAVIKGRHTHQIIIGYAHLSPADMEKGLQRLKKYLK